MWTWEQKRRPTVSRHVTSLEHQGGEGFSEGDANFLNYVQ